MPLDSGDSHAHAPVIAEEAAKPKEPEPQKADKEKDKEKDKSSRVRRTLVRRRVMMT